MKKFLGDVSFKIRRDAAAVLGFPYIQPAKASKASTTSGFADSVSDADLKEMFRRNQAAHAIVADVAADAVTAFDIVDPEGNILEDLNHEVQLIIQKLALLPLTRSLLFARLYGHCGLLVGYAGGKGLDTAIKGNPQIIYLQPIPKSWIKEIHLKKDTDGNMLLPHEIDHYEISIGNATKNIDATRLIHLANPSVDEESPEGESSLLCVFDDLCVLKSMSWGAGQAMWRHGGGLTVFIAPDSADSQAQIDAIDEVTTNMNAMTALTMPPGTEVVTGSPGALNPKNYFDACLQLISIGTRIPVSILRGSVAGSLTSSEKDRKDYSELLDSIRKTLATPALIDIIHRLQASGQLPEQEFMIKWARPSVMVREEQQSKLLEAQVELVTAQVQTELAKNPRT